MKSGLATSLWQGDERKYDPTNVEGILSPTDEIEFWSDISKMNVAKASDEKLREKAEHISWHF